MKKILMRLSVILMALILIIGAVGSERGGLEAKAVSDSVTVAPVVESTPDAAPSETPAAEPTVPAAGDSMPAEPVNEPAAEQTVTPAAEQTAAPDAGSEETPAAEPAADNTQTPAADYTETPAVEPAVEEESGAGEAEEPTSDGSEIETYYDVNGVEILRDENGELILPETIEYDEAGEPILYDAQGNVVKGKAAEAPAEEPAADAAEEPAAEEEEAKFAVHIYFLNEQEYYFAGDKITIASIIEGECNSPAYQWQVWHASSEKEEWIDIPGANDSIYEYVLNDSNYADSFRVVVTDQDAAK